MKRHVQIFLALMLLLLLGSRGNRVGAQGGNTIADVVAADGRFSQFNAAVEGAGLQQLLDSSGPYTVLAPTDEALAAGALAGLAPNQMRQAVLYHTLQGNHNAGTLSAQSSMRTALGQPITIENGERVTINQTAHLVVTDVATANGTIHVIDALLQPQGSNFAPPAGGQAAPAQGGPAPLAAAQPQNAVLVMDAAQNPAYVSGGTVPYWSGVNTDSNGCRGMTWVLLRQMDGVSLVGSDRQTNPYRGDTACSQTLPMLCINRDMSQPIHNNYANGWAYGRIALTTPIAGSSLGSRAAADQLCAQVFGGGWRMAEFHDGGLGTAIGAVSGHDFWALAGNLPVGQRFWVSIGDQPANPWNSNVTRMGPPNIVGAPNIWNVGDDSAYVGETPLRMSRWQGEQAGRGHCKGLTWVIHRQIDGKVQVGADQSSNPYVGDRGCGDSYPVLCIRVDGFAPPAPSNGIDYSRGWSGGYVKLSNAISGSEISNRTRANAVCEATFGAGWRMATFHDGNLGLAGTTGWEFWAYGGLQPGLRFWVGINDQYANPWNP